LFIFDFCYFSEVLLEPNTKKLLAGNGIGIADESSMGTRTALFTDGTCLRDVGYNYFRSEIDLEPMAYLRSRTISFS